MNPYEADPRKIPEDDRYVKEPFYGRYLPQPEDFQVDRAQIQSSTAKSIAYWQSVLLKCDSSNCLYDNEFGGRDVFALGSIIVKSRHLKPLLQEDSEPERDYSLADANEVKAITLARALLNGTGIQLPEILFAGKIADRSVLIQSRVPGVGLNVAWQYLSPTQKQGFKEQGREFLRRIYTHQVDTTNPTYVVPDDDPELHRGIQSLEKDILFGDKQPLTITNGIGLMHNDFTQSNIIVDNDRIVGVVDWEMAGFFSWEQAAEVHRQIRGPKRENFKALDLPEEMLSDILYWTDLYDIA